MAGAQAAGDDLVYKGVSAALSFHGMNTSLFAAGDNGQNPNLIYKTVEYKDEGKETVPEILLPQQSVMWCDPDRGYESYGGYDRGAGASPALSRNYQYLN